MLHFEIIAGLLGVGVFLLITLTSNSWLGTKLGDVLSAFFVASSAFGMVYIFIDIAKWWME